MSCSKQIKYKLIVQFLIGFSITFLINTCGVYDKESISIFEEIESINYSNIEAPVVDKINGLLEKTKNDPDSAELWGKLGMNLYIHGYKNESVPAFKKAASLDYTDFRWTYFCARALNELNSEETIVWFEKSKELKSDYPPLCVIFGNRRLVSGELLKAKKLFNDALISFKNVPHAYVGLAKISIAQNDLDSAYINLNKALEIAPAFRETHVLLADVYRRKGEISKAESEFKIIEQLPDKLDLKDPFYNQMVDEGVSSFWRQVRGDNYLQSGQLEKAEIEFRKVTEIKSHASFNNNLGNVYQKQKKYDLAAEQYQLALELDSVNIDALNNLGVVYFQTGKMEKAISLVKRSLKLNPNSKDGYLNLGTFYKLQNNRSESVKCFKQGMELAPDDLRFAYQLAWLFSSAPEKKLRNGEEALRLAKLIFENKDIDMSSKFDLVAAALAENGQFEKAREMAAQAHQSAVKSGKRQLAPAIFKRIKLYKMNKPYRESI